MTARGIVQRGCLASSPSGAAASKPMNARIPKTIPLKTPEKSLEASGLTFSGLNACRFSWSKFERSIQIERPRKIVISNAPEHDAGPGREADVAVRQDEDDQGGGEDPPRPADVPPDLVLDDVIGRPREDEEEERGDERCEEHEAPPREEARAGPERRAHVRVEAAGRRHLLRELADPARHERAGDRGEEDGERKRLAAANDTETRSEKATAAAGAMCVIDWKSASGSPIECSRRWSNCAAGFGVSVST